jgi:hypothetical protein
LLRLVSPGIHRNGVHAVPTLVYGLEHVLAHATLRADPVIGYVLEGGPWLYTTVRVANLRVIHIPAR